MEKKKRFIVLVIVMTVALGMIYWGSRPSKGKITLEEASRPEKKEIEQKQYLGKFINFWYGGNFRLRASGGLEDENGTSEKVELLGETGDSSYWVIAINDTTARDLSEVSAVQFRRLNSDVYEEGESEIKVSGIRSLFFKKKDRSEFLTLTIKDSKLITVALTVNTNDEATEQKFLDFVNGVEIM